MIWYKRLEAGTFQFPFAQTGRREIAAWELGVLLEGIDLGESGYVYPGGFEYVMYQGSHPPQGRSWIRNYKLEFWEVDAEELRSNSERII